MVSFGEKAKIKKAGNLNSGRSYVFTTVSDFCQESQILRTLHDLDFYGCNFTEKKCCKKCSDVLHELT